MRIVVRGIPAPQGSKRHVGGGRMVAGLDLYEHGRPPETCMCTWSWGPPGFRWERIGIKEDCPWHLQVAQLLERTGGTISVRQIIDQAVAEWKAART